MRARWMWLAVPSLTISFAFVACGSEDDADPGGTNPDGSAPKDDATTPPSRDATTGSDSALDSAPDAPAADAEGGATDAASDAGDADAGPPPLSCKTLHAASPSLPSGVYTIDPDGAGPIEPVPAYCDMVFDGGGWTLIYSNVAGRSLLEPGDAGTDASPDAAFYVRPPASGQLGAFKGELVKPLAEGATQVHIRTPFAADAGPDGGAAWISSIVLADGGITKPIQNLRSLFGLNRNTGGFADWSGPNAVGTRLSYQESGGCAAVNTAVYPLIYWACNNAEGLHVSDDKARWNYVTENAPNEDLEVYVR